MNEDKIIPFPKKTHQKIEDLIAQQDELIRKYNADVKKLNWFTAGLMSGILSTFGIFSLVIYFSGVKF